jgi:glycosyltransferase involved in cell wall biosynthesis
MSLFSRVNEPRETVDLFWSGGHSHYEDWYVIKDAIAEVMNKYPHTRFVVMGTLFESLLPKVDKSRIVFHKWVDTIAYPYKLSLLSPDISLIPLRDTPFNRRKSAIKWIEMGALKVPSVASYISPYAEMEPLKKDNGVYVQDNDKDAWVKGLSLLIEDSALRKSMGQSAYETVKENFEIRNRYHDWVVAYQEAICRSRQTLQPAN